MQLMKGDQCIQEAIISSKNGVCGLGEEFAMSTCQCPATSETDSPHWVILCDLPLSLLTTI